jgi:hypothetical protein
MEDKKEEKKKSSWKRFNGFSTITMPSGLTHQFDFTKLPNEVFGYYGKKQWIADAGASAKDTPDKDRLALMVEAYNEAVEKGVELTDEGRVSIKGKVRANATPKTQDNLILPTFETLSLGELKSMKAMVSKGFMKLSPELLAKLDAKIAGGK